MNIFDQYGIKEVADVTLYSIHKKTDGSGDVYYVPALYLDTLKVSTVEKTGENTWATGGLGNARLISWDYGKTINVTLEDALCTPASLGLCWGGTLSADWKDAQVDYQTDVCVCQNPVLKLSRMEKAIYPRNDRKNGIISRLLPQVKDNTDSIDDFNLLKVSAVVDGTKISGHGIVNGHSYGWKMAIESAVKSIAVVPDRFFDVTGRSYTIDQNRKVSVDSLPDYENYKDAIIYRINTSSEYRLPPLATIIFDNEMQNRRGIEQTVTVNIPVSALADFHNNDEVKVTTLLYKAKALWEGNCFMTTTESGTVLDIGDNSPNSSGTDEEYYGAKKTHVLVKPNEVKKIEDVSRPFALTVRVFTLNNYGIKKYLGNINVPKVPADVEGTLVSYLQNHATTLMFEWDEKAQDFGSTSDTAIGREYDSISKITGTSKIAEADYLAIVVDVNNNYHALVGKTEKIATRTIITYSDEITEGENDTYYLDQDSTAIYVWDGDSFEIATETPTEEDPKVEVYVDDGKLYLTKTIKEEPIETDNNDKFAQRNVVWTKPETGVDLSQFKNIDMWLRFNSINEMIYFLITKYEDDITDIKPVYVNPKSEDKDGNWDVNRNTTTTTPRTSSEDAKTEGRLWAYVDPRTMKPFEDDYWFHSGEPFYIKSLTLAPNGKKLKAQQIIVRADEWPGMYMMVGETYIRNRDTGKDERVQIKFPQAKVKADQTLTLQADGDPTTFTLNLEIAKPRNGHMMELTAYEVAPKMIEGENGCFYAADGSSEVVIE